jgi:hypothetical protein
MRHIILVVVLFAATLALGKDGGYVAVTRNNTGIYEHQIRKLHATPLFSVDPSVPLLVLSSKGRHVNIRLADGRTGWVEQRLVQPVSSKAIFFDHLHVGGYIDSPELGIILDGSEPLDGPILLSRSFRDHLGENIDRETATRAAGSN